MVGSARPLAIGASYDHQQGGAHHQIDAHAGPSCSHTQRCRKCPACSSMCGRPKSPCCLPVRIGNLLRRWQAAHRNDCSRQPSTVGRLPASLFSPARKIQTIRTIFGGGHCRDSSFGYPAGRTKLQAPLKLNTSNSHVLVPSLYACPRHPNPPSSRQAFVPPRSLQHSPL